MTEKLQISIYKIENDISLNYIKSITEANGFKEQSLEIKNKKEFILTLYYKRRPTTPQWKGFIKEISTEGQDAAKKQSSGTESFILYLSKEDKTYAIMGGFAYHTIKDYVDINFGIEVLARLIKREDRNLKSTKERLLSGGIIGTTKYFRKSVNLFENESFSKFYQEIIASLDKDSLIHKLGFSQKEIKKEVLCVAKSSSFRIKKSATLDQLLEIINKCDSLLNIETPFQINNVRKLEKSRYGKLIAHLKDELEIQLWERYKNPDYEIDFDLCNYDWEQYLTASRYIASRGTNGTNIFGDHEFDNLSNVDILFEAIKNHQWKPKSKEDFVKLIRRLRIISRDDAGDDLTNGYFTDHLHGDIHYDNARYFFVDKAWHLIEDTFIERMNEACRAHIKNLYGHNLSHAWDNNYQSENDYNKSFLGEKNTLVLDRVIPDNIEVCDIMKWDDENLYLYHVKSGFSNTMRDLCSQITISASRVKQDLASDKSFIKKLYQEMKNKIGGTAYFDAVGGQSAIITEDAFLSLFSKKIIYVLAVKDTSNTQRSIKEIEQFKSNIAKFSLQDLVSNMRSIEVQLAITQISI